MILFRQTILNPQSAIFHRLLITVLFLSMLLTACGEEITPNSTSLSAATATKITTVKTDTSAQALVLNWLKGIPCGPPCLEGIIPGKTTAKEAVELLKKNPLISGITNYKDAITWEWYLDNKLYVSDASFDPKDPNQVIYSIRPTFEVSLTPSKVDLKLKDVIQEYGEPPYVIALNNRLVKNNHYNFTFIYVTRGVSFQSSVDKKSNFNSNMKLEKPELFIPTEAGFQKIFGPLRLIAIKWEGFKDFDFYCRDDFCADV